MNQLVILRNKPKLEITLKEDGFELLDNFTPNNNGIYSYENLKSVELHKKWTDWVKSIIRYIPVFFKGGIFGGNFKDKANLKIALDEQILKLWLFDAYMEKVKIVKQKLNEKSLLTKKS